LLSDTQCDMMPGSASMRSPERAKYEKQSTHLSATPTPKSKRDSVGQRPY
jgi:hypothetical protein